MALKYIKDANALLQTVKTLNTKSEFSFDTEFDRFQFGYGFTLSLLQIFDGEFCYIIDPGAIKNLDPLWECFVNPDITKIVYSCSEDIQILKVNGCPPRNIYDLQIAAKLCNHPANSFAELLEAELGIVLNKSSQRSDWRRRPLTEEQITYASNDVTGLIALKNILEKKAVENGVTTFLAEDNLACEQIEVSHFRIKISAEQKKKFSRPQQNKFYALMEWRNEIAQQYDLPPFKVCADSVLESFIESPEKLATSATKGFHRHLQNDKKALNNFNNLFEKDAIHFPLPPFFSSEKKFARPIPYTDNGITENDYELLKEQILSQYGVIAGEYIIRGFKKSLTSNLGFDHLKNYQKKVINEAAIQSGIKFKI